jgi:phospholipid/cholesterol/gamma-HCH transport system substrate-binding protein
MEGDRKGVELFVGLFLLIGLGCIGTMVVMFGRMGTGAHGYYPLTVEFPNASGLFKGAEVLLSGAKIGQVAEPPTLLRKSVRVQVTLHIRSDVQIPRQTRFVVGSSGLLGDRYVDAQLEPGFDPADAFQPNELIPGRYAGGGMDELTSKGSTVLDKLTEELEHIQALTTRLNEGLLNEKNLKNIEATFENLKGVSQHFKDTSRDLDLVVAQAGTTVESAQKLMKTGDAAAADLRLAIDDARKLLGSATKAVDSTAALVEKAGKGGGTLSTLINDKQMAEDLRTLAANLRRSGVLFYKDRPLATPAPRRR